MNLFYVFVCFYSILFNFKQSVCHNDPSTLQIDLTTNICANRLMILFRSRSLLPLILRASTNLQYFSKHLLPRSFPLDLLFILLIGFSYLTFLYNLPWFLLFQALLVMCDPDLSALIDWLKYYISQTILHVAKFGVNTGFERRREQKSKKSSVGLVKTKYHLKYVQGGVKYCLCPMHENLL